MEAVILEASVCGTHLHSERLLNTMLYIKVSTLIATGQEVVLTSLLMVVNLALWSLGIEGNCFHRH